MVPTTVETCTVQPVPVAVMNCKIKDRGTACERLRHVLFWEMAKRIGERHLDGGWHGRDQVKEIIDGIHGGGIIRACGEGHSGVGRSGFSRGRSGYSRFSLNEKLQMARSTLCDGKRAARSSRFRRYRFEPVPLG